MYVCIYVFMYIYYVLISPSNTLGVYLCLWAWLWLCLCLSVYTTLATGASSIGGERCSAKCGSSEHHLVFLT